MIKIGFIGAGITGTTLAITLQKHGYNIVAVSSRNISSAERLAARISCCHVFKSSQEVADHADFIFITTPDDIIQEIVTRVRWHSGQFIVHCSGAHSKDIIRPPHIPNVFSGCLHPLQTFASIDQAIEDISNATFAIEAEEPLLTVLREMALVISGNHIIVDAKDKVLYHAAAVFACNYLVTLIKLATDIWSEFGISREQSIKALIPLLRGTIGNIEAIGLPNCLTGPIARGDTGTIKKHLEALEILEPNLIATYKQLGKQTIPIALEKGLNTDKARELQKILTRELQGVLP